MITLKINSHIGRGGIEAETFAPKIQQLTGDARLDISSPGGSLLDGLMIFSEIDNKSKEVKIQPRINGLAASMGHMLSLSGSELPEVVDYAAILLHKPRIGDDVEGADAYQVNMLKTLMNSAVTAMSAKSGIDRAELEELMSANDGEGTWLTANEAYELGLTKEPIKTEEVDKGAKMESLKEAYFQTLPEVVFQLKPKIEMSDKANEVSMAAFDELKMKLEDSNKALEAANKKAESLEAVVTEMKTAEAEKVVLKAIEDGKLKEESKDKWVQLGLNDLDLVKEAFAGMSTTKEAPKMEIEDAPKMEVTESYDELRKNNPAKLKQIAENTPELFAKMVSEHKAKIK